MSAAEVLVLVRECVAARQAAAEFEAAGRMRRAWEARRRVGALLTQIEAAVARMPEERPELGEREIVSSFEDWVGGRLLISGSEARDWGHYVASWVRDSGLTVEGGL